MKFRLPPAIRIRTDMSRSAPSQAGMADLSDGFEDLAASFPGRYGNTPPQSPSGSFAGALPGAHTRRRAATWSGSSSNDSSPSRSPTLSPQPSSGDRDWEVLDDTQPPAWLCNLFHRLETEPRGIAEIGLVAQFRDPFQRCWPEDYLDRLQDIIRDLRRFPDAQAATGLAALAHALDLMAPERGVPALEQAHAKAWLLLCGQAARLQGDNPDDLPNDLGTLPDALVSDGLLRRLHRVVAPADQAALTRLALLYANMQDDDAAETARGVPATPLNGRLMVGLLQTETNPAFLRQDIANIRECDMTRFNQSLLRHLHELPMQNLPDALGLLLNQLRVTDHTRDALPAFWRDETSSDHMAPLQGDAQHLGGQLATLLLWTGPTLPHAVGTILASDLPPPVLHEAMQQLCDSMARNDAPADLPWRARVQTFARLITPDAKMPWPDRPNFLPASPWANDTGRLPETDLSGFDAAFARFILHAPQDNHWQTVGTILAARRHALQSEPAQLQALETRIMTGLARQIDQTRVEEQVLRLHGLLPALLQDLTPKDKAARLLQLHRGLSPFGRRAMTLPLLQAMATVTDQPGIADKARHLIAGITPTTPALHACAGVARKLLGAARSPGDGELLIMLEDVCAPPQRNSWVFGTTPPKMGFFSGSPPRRPDR